MSYFQQRYDALLAWSRQRTGGALPRQHASDKEEQVLGQFLNGLQRSHKAGDLGEEKLEALLRVPVWVLY